MIRQAIVIFFSLFIFSCTGKRPPGNSTPDKTGTLNESATVHRIALADLPDSLQPKVVTLDKLPTQKVSLPAGGGKTYIVTDAEGMVHKVNEAFAVEKMLQVLKNSKGEIVKDKEGNPFIMGDGGIADFTTFTTDDGLALDAISCSIMDHAGNLWFGTVTQGGGVSRYDGRSFTTFSTAQGLANNIVNCMAEDRAGNIWFGTYGGGVSRYDGRSFTNYSTADGLPGNNVISICADDAGNVWLGTMGGGLSRYDPGAKAKAAKLFTTYSQGLAGTYAVCITTDRAGNLWIGTEAGISRIDRSWHESACYSGKCGHNLAVAREAEAHNKEISRYLTTLTVNQGLAGNQVNCIAEDSMGNLWFGTNNGVSRYDSKLRNSACNMHTCKHDLHLPQDIKDHNGEIAKAFTNYSIAQGLGDSAINTITIDRKGNIWFGTNVGGVTRYDPTGGENGRKFFSTFTAAQGLTCNKIRSITEDKNGSLWFGTYGGGVSRYDGKAFITYTVEQGLGFNIIRSIAEDKKGNLWFGTGGGGVSKFDGRSFTTYSTPLVNGNIKSILEDKSGNLWFGTWGGGICLYDGKSFTTFYDTVTAACNQVVSIAEDRNGHLWFGTNGAGVRKYDGKTLSTFSSRQGLANDIVLSIAEDKEGNLWFGTYGGGVSRFDGKSFINFSSAQGLADDNVFKIFEDKDGNLWFGTSYGLSVMSAGNAAKIGGQVKDGSIKGLRFFKTFTKTDGLPDNTISQILQLANGKMAVGTNQGITLFHTPADLSMLNHMEIFNSNTGFPVKDISGGQNCMFLDSKGIIWAGTGSEKTALVRFDPSISSTSSAPPVLVIQGIKINEENICWNDLKIPSRGATDSNAEDVNVAEEVTTLGSVLTVAERDSMRRKFGDIRFDSISRNYPIPQHLVLPYHHNDVIFDYCAIEVDDPKRVNYRYILEGYDDDWSPPLKSMSAAFGNIREGTYTFKVKAQAPNGVWCEPVTYMFTVLPPWYRTWWAYVIYILGTVTALFLVFRWRTASLRSRQRELEQTVTQRTAEVVAEKKEVEKQKERSEELLLNILPAEVAEELKTKGSAEAKLIDEVTVLFTDFKGFTQLSERLSPKALVAEINDCFSAFDLIMQKYGVEKIKTIGDSYMAAGGLPTPNRTHATDVVNAAIEIQAYMQQHKARKEAAGEFFFEIRTGVHTGPVVAGIVGVKKFQYDIWGDTVNTASRMESSGEIGKVNISETTYELVRNKFTCEYRGEIDAKGKGKLKMYYVVEQ